MSLVTYLLEQTPVYSLWQAPFAARKFAPIARHTDLRRVRRVLDVGCGPGTNTALFAHSDYLGIDINPEYVESARRKHKRQFVVADVAKYDDRAAGKFDFILVNSFLHHVDDSTASAILSNLSKLLTDDGHVHILDLVLPESASIARILAHSDRGDFPRTLQKWREIFCASFDQENFEPYDLGACGLTLWKMLYFKGKTRH